jgi:preprotein translocase subunit SecD
MKKKNLLQRAIIIAVVTLFGLYIVIGPRHRPSIKDFTWSGIKATLASNIHLGLDLKGGSHLVMRVKTEEFLKHLTEGNAVAAENAAKDAGFDVKSTRSETGNGNYRVMLEVADASKAEDIKTAVQKKVEFGDTSVWTYAQSGNQCRGR